MMHVQPPKPSHRPISWAFAATVALGFVAGCEDHDAPTPDYPVEPAVYPWPGKPTELPEGEVSYTGEVGAVHTRTFLLEVEVGGDFEDLLVVVDDRSDVPVTGDEVSVTGRFGKATGQMHARLYDDEFESVEDGRAQTPVLIASRVKPK